MVSITELFTDSDEMLNVCPLDCLSSLKLTFTFCFYFRLYERIWNLFKISVKVYIFVKALTMKKILIYPVASKNFTICDKALVPAFYESSYIYVYCTCIYRASKRFYFPIWLDNFHLPYNTVHKYLKKRQTLPESSTS